MQNKYEVYNTLGQQIFFAQEGQFTSAKILLCGVPVISFVFFNF